MPLPGVDVAVDLGLLSTMLPDISKRFGLDHESVSKLPPHLAEKLLVIVTSLGNNFIGKRITQELIIATLKRIGIRVASKSVTKYIPFVGSAVAATISFGAMKLVGNNHVDDCYKAAKHLLDDVERETSLKSAA